MPQASWTDTLLVVAQIGDLHITDARERNYRDFLAIAAEIGSAGSSTIDFVFLPGDNADNGTREQYALVKTGLRLLDKPVHIITGDHDMEKGSLANFYSHLSDTRLPFAASVRGVRCVFLDFCGSGKGGPDFRLDEPQIAFLQTEIASAHRAHERLVIFMHTYPVDLVEPTARDALNRSLSDPAVKLVAMGHTHYNELANDGSTIFAATRSTGQIEEGPPGYAVMTVDGDAVAWRFKLLDESMPFVMITSPADRRLVVGNARSDASSLDVHAIAFGPDPNIACKVRIEDGAWTAMHRTPDTRGWEASLPFPVERRAKITVRATDRFGRPGFDSIDLGQSPERAEARDIDGSDRHSIGAWPERHVLGSQLGPNRNGGKRS